MRLRCRVRKGIMYLYLSIGHLCIPEFFFSRDELPNGQVRNLVWGRGALCGLGKRFTHNLLQHQCYPVLRQCTSGYHRVVLPGEIRAVRSLCPLDSILAVDFILASPTQQLFQPQGE
jgi:hypothetical protein